MRLPILVACAFLLQGNLGLGDLPMLSKVKLTEVVPNTTVTTVNVTKPALKSAGKSLAKSMPSQVEENTGRITSEVNPFLKWVRWSGSLPKWAVSVFVPYTSSTDYICCALSGCLYTIGYYNPSAGPYCINPCRGSVNKNSDFDVLVNEEALEFLEWKDFPGSIPGNAVTSHSSHNLYVAENVLGVGVIWSQTFFLPWIKDQKEYKYPANSPSVRIMTVNTGQYQLKIFNVEYKISALDKISKPPVTLQQFQVINNQCKSIQKTAQFQATTERQSTWQTSFSLSASVSTTISAKVPLISSFELSASFTTETTITKGNSLTETVSHSLSVEVEVPPNQSCMLKMTGKQFQIDVPFTADLSKQYEGGQVYTTTVSGIYHGVQVGEIQAIAERCQTIPNAISC